MQGRAKRERAPVRPAVDVDAGAGADGPPDPSGGAMTAGDRENAAAAAAVTLGEQLATEYWQAAGQTPGVGWQVALPSVADGQGRPVKGEGYDVAPTAPALTPPTRPRLVPDYGPPAAGGAGYHATQPGSVAPFDGVAWPSGRASSIVHVLPRQVGCDRYFRCLG